MTDRKPKTESKAQTLSLASLLLHDLFSFQRTKKEEKNSPDCHRISLSPSSLRRRRTEREKAKGRAINNCLKIEREREKKGFLKRREEEGKKGSHLSISLHFFPALQALL